MKFIITKQSDEKIYFRAVDGDGEEAADSMSLEELDKLQSRLERAVDRLYDTPSEQEVVEL